MARYVVSNATNLKISYTVKVGPVAIVFSPEMSPSLIDII